MKWSREYKLVLILCFVVGALSYDFGRVATFWMFCGMCLGYLVTITYSSLIERDSDESRS